MSRREALAAMAGSAALGATSVNAARGEDPHARLYEEAQALDLASAEATARADKILFALPPDLRGLADRLGHQQLSSEEEQGIRSALAATGYPAARDQAGETRARLEATEAELYTTRATTLGGLLVQVRALSEDLESYGGINSDESDVAGAKNIVATRESFLPKMRAAA